jgi:DNA-directed RNA polymerase subunit RPC12/RpoP
MALVDLTQQNAMPQSYACQSCGRIIGASEQAYQVEGLIVCPQCCNSISQPTTQPMPSRRRKIAYADFRIAAVVGGAAFTILGCFCPLTSVPLFGEIDYFGNGHRDGIVVAAICVAAIIGVMTPLIRWVWLCGLLNAGIIIVALVRSAAMMNDLQQQVDAGKFGPLGGLILHSVRLEWGWAVLLIGTAVLICSPLFRWRRV